MFFTYIFELLNMNRYKMKIEPHIILKTDCSLIYNLFKNDENISATLIRSSILNSYELISVFKE